MLAKELSVKRLSIYGVALIILIGAVAAFFALRAPVNGSAAPGVAPASVNVAAQPAPTANGTKILAFGDSLTAGYGLAASEAFPAALQTALRAKGIAAQVQNAGVSGDTSAVARGRLDWVLKGAKATPDLVIIELGGNDMLRGISPAETQANIEAMISALKAKDIRILLAGMRASPNLGADYQTRFDAVFPKLAAKHGLILYPFFMEGVAANMTLLQADGIHPNPKGVDVIVRGILPSVVKTLE